MEEFMKRLNSCIESDLKAMKRISLEDEMHS